MNLQKFYDPGRVSIAGTRRAGRLAGCATGPPPLKGPPDFELSGGCRIGPYGGKRGARLGFRRGGWFRLITALLAEISEEWESGKIYLNLETTTQPSV